MKGRQDSGTFRRRCFVVCNAVWSVAAQLELQLIGLVQQISCLFMTELCSSTTLHRRLETVEVAARLVSPTFLKRTRESVEMRFELMVMANVQRLEIL